MVKVGDEIIVMSLGYDQKGRLNLSRKAALPKPAKKEDKEESKEEKKAEKAEKKSKKKEDAE
jgi:polyribonucleotide nucleotidyltransferase